MDHTTDAGRSAAHYHDDDAPFAEERNRYLRHCAERGATHASLKIKRNELLWIAPRLGPNAPSEGIDIEVLRQIAIERQQAHGALTAARRVVDIGRPWLRFLGWWREPSTGFEYQGQLEEYVRWMRDERGFTPSTLEQRIRVIGRFLRWCDQTNRQLGDLQAVDIDAYFVSQATGRWSRVSVATTASALRVFLRYAGKRGLCANNLAGSIDRPRLYREESLPYAPNWSDVQRMLADADTDKPRDIRDRAILLLLAVYGMRSGEIVALRLDRIDWAGGTLGLFRLKRRQPQIYPLVSSVAEALARYIDTVRPSSSHPEVFLCMQAPRRPLKAGSIYDVANRRFVALGIEAAHRGGHALRHACASRLLAEGLSIKEIGDHLGHRSAATTSIYAKVNLAALREVGAFDLGALQ
ncbi:tyrosine-type recombinase/integrase [Rhizobium tumorigenes]|uniref:Tyrosine-type recombinase/integrase n=2 Tax=Hyphomicrobiales TaxID=356 RepID=A0AAF1K8R8_9HYPH|nr:tyrosine-type recombinase/integrase [Rhizobium tumorigenes]WFR98278.1 tyrosine-type recombinase/integrase [Rhizobium tumorigenes]WFS03791.1 tyrosine-type recombinase/integrase [Rhizobium tumorigenes]